MSSFGLSWFHLPLVVARHPGWFERHRLTNRLRPHGSLSREMILTTELASPEYTIAPTIADIHAQVWAIRPGCELNWTA